MNIQDTINGGWNIICLFFFQEIGFLFSKRFATLIEKKLLLEPINQRMKYVKRSSYKTRNRSLAVFRLHIPSLSALPDFSCWYSMCTWHLKKRVGKRAQWSGWRHRGYTGRHRHFGHRLSGGALPMEEPAHAGTERRESEETTGHRINKARKQLFWEFPFSR